MEMKIEVLVSLVATPFTNVSIISMLHMCTAVHMVGLIST
jgi:hypothetical protein